MMKANEIFGSAETTEVKAAETAKTQPKTTAKKTTPKTAEKKTAKKEDKEPVQEEKTETAEAAKTTAKKTTKTAEKRPVGRPKSTAAKKTAEKKTTAARKPVKKEVKHELYFQYNGNQIDEETLINRVKADLADQNIEVKELKVYLKPEDNACYYVANGNVAGKVDLY